MRAFMALATLAIVATASAQAPKKPNWTRSAMTPESFAKRTDLAMKTAAGLTAETRSRAEVFNLKNHRSIGEHKGKLYILSPKVFHLEYPFATEDKGYSNWMTYREVADGKQFSRRRSGGWRDKSAIPTRAPIPGNMLGTWPILGPGRVIGSVGTNQMPLARFIKEARLAGATLTVEKATVGQINLERLHVVRKGKPKGPRGFDFEIVVEPVRGLPLSMFNQTTDMRGKKVVTRWGAKWNMSPGQNFPPEVFYAKE